MYVYRVYIRIYCLRPYVISHECVVLVTTFMIDQFLLIDLISAHRQRVLKHSAIRAFLRLKLIIQTFLTGNYMRKSAGSTGRVYIGAPSSVLKDFCSNHVIIPRCYHKELQTVIHLTNPVCLTGLTCASWSINWGMWLKLYG